MNAEKHADFAVPNILKSVTTNHLKPARLGIGIVSAGKVGAVLGAALRSAGHAIVGVRAESDASAERAENLLPGIPVLPTEQIIERSELVLLAVPDDALQPVIEGIAAGAWSAPGSCLCTPLGGTVPECLSHSPSRGLLALPCTQP